jgi:hypothetical protein
VLESYYSKAVGAAQQKYYKQVSYMTDTLYDVFNTVMNLRITYGRGYFYSLLENFPPWSDESVSINKCAPDENNPYQNCEY